MNKKVTVVAYEKKTANMYGEQLSKLFRNHIKIECYSIQDKNLTNIDSDIIIASTYSIYDLVKRNSNNYTNVIVADITLRKESLEKLAHLPNKTKAMLVNSTLEMSVETIGLIYNSGVNHIDLIPVHPNMKDIPDYDLAITPGEVELVPNSASTIIDLGDRVLSMRTIVNVAAKLNLSYLLQSEGFKAYFQSLANNDLGMEELYGKVDILEKKLDLILQIFDDGVIAVGQGKKINFINKTAINILNLEYVDVVGLEIDKVIKELSEIEMFSQTKSIKDKVITTNGQHLVISVHPISNLSYTINYLILIRRFTDTEKEQNRIRKQIISKGYKAKYYFEDIIGESEVIKNIKDKSRKMAASDSSILIYGRSGTGKELFAQSIHNCSYRKSNPFIAINCASIPENLLESELFGYEEGAFTGARKGGKIGYFELAHMGTLFLDEISEMSLNLQARLLRVLQEMEVVRVGGDNVINIDVRIITASNKNLEDLVRQNKFREDLYYRINVLRVNIPNLNERKEDIPLLVNHFKNQFNASFEISTDGIDAIKKHSWEGNIRELRNFIERLIYLDKKVITVNDVFECIDMDLNESNSFFYNRDEEFHFNNFISEHNNNLRNIYYVLSVLASNNNSNRLGRRSISEKLTQNAINISEQQVRTVLNILSEYNMISISRGRGGTEISSYGFRVFNLLKKEYKKYILY